MHGLRVGGKFDFSTPITENITLYAVLIPVETTPTETVTEAPTEAPTAAPTEAEAPTGGCGSVLALAILPCLLCGVILTLKKREN